MAGSYYIAASYVKWLESAGARAIAIPFDAPDDIVESIFLQVNGILFPGGATTDMPSSAKRIWNLAKEANDNGDFFPLWGTCLGFELMVMLAADDNSIMHSGFDSYNISLPLFFTKEAPSSRMFQSKKIRNIAESNNITMNNHQNGIEPNRFREHEILNQLYNILSTNVDRRGREFVSSIEAKNYPFYAVQYHPEKNNFEYGSNSVDVPYEVIPHSFEAVTFSFYMATLFVNEARRNTHVYTMPSRFPSVWSYELRRGVELEQILIIPNETTSNHVLRGTATSSM
eukprot:CAMPEP_0172433398 /NCGR_PEP_ID=MMETSP1064-20121228/67993_1 /TAXON_ID=202472 /ORGANISM="Aulacoseira subarctica , Strain CCAP 1002/5" /LENGTH=284 /DNA_ID=CAMNT_0013181301 /DNA_START=77 /DNA_END=931 /DNA_ORIENTATION=-